MDTFPTVGVPYEVEWVTIYEPNPGGRHRQLTPGGGRAGQGPGCGHLRPRRGHMGWGRQSLLRLHGGRRGQSRPGLRVRSRQPDHHAHLPVRQREDAGESGQHRDRAQDRRHLPAGGSRPQSISSADSRRTERSTTSPARSPTTPSSAAAASAPTVRSSSSISRARAAVPRRVLRTRTR